MNTFLGLDGFARARQKPKSLAFIRHLERCSRSRLAPNSWPGAFIPVAPAFLSVAPGPHFRIVVAIRLFLGLQIARQECGCSGHFRIVLTAHHIKMLSQPSFLFSQFGPRARISAHNNAARWAIGLRPTPPEEVL